MTRVKRRAAGKTLHSDIIVDDSVVVTRGQKRGLNNRRGSAEIRREQMSAVRVASFEAKGQERPR